MEHSHGQSDVSSRFSSKMNTAALRLVGKYFGASLVAQSVKNLPAVQKTWVRFLGWEDPLEKETATHSRILAWKIPVDRGAWQATVHGVARVGHDLATKTPPPSLSYLHTLCFPCLMHLVGKISVCYGHTCCTENNWGSLFFYPSITTTISEFDNVISVSSQNNEKGNDCRKFIILSGHISMMLLKF